jgi:hypothetical protein
MTSFPLRNIHVQDGNLSCTIHADIEFANAIRRTIISDTESFAPVNIDFEVNTSCQTNEFIAHRIGLIPFCQNDIDEHTTLELHVKDRTVYANDINGAVMAFHNITIMKMIEGQELKCKIHFGKGSGKVHSRFCPIAACAHFLKDDVIHFKFEVINDIDPLQILKKSVQNLSNRLEHLQNSIQVN